MIKSYHYKIFFIKTDIGVAQDNLTSVSHELNCLLADEFGLYTKRNAHWNVEGIDFYNKHIFFEKQYTELEQII